MTDSTFARLRSRTAVVLTAALSAAVAWRATRRRSDNAGGIPSSAEIEHVYDRIAPLYDLLSSP